MGAKGDVWWLVEAVWGLDESYWELVKAVLGLDESYWCLDESY